MLLQTFYIVKESVISKTVQSYEQNEYWLLYPAQQSAQFHYFLKKFTGHPLESGVFYFIFDNMKRALSVDFSSDGKAKNPRLNYEDFRT